MFVCVYFSDLTKNVRISEPDWSPLFGAFATLPTPAAERHCQEMTTLLQRHSLHVPDNLVDLMTGGFPCQCSAVQLPSCRKVDAVKMMTMTKKMVRLEDGCTGLSAAADKDRETTENTDGVKTKANKQNTPHPQQTNEQNTPPKQTNKQTITTNEKQTTTTKIKQQQNTNTKTTTTTKQKTNTVTLRGRG